MFSSKPAGGLSEFFVINFTRSWSRGSLYLFMTRHVLILLGLLSAPALVRGELDTAAVITLEESVARAAEANEDLIIAREAVEQARYALKTQQAAYWPTVSGSAGYARSDADSREDGPSDSTSAGVSAQYSLFSGGADRARVRQAEAALAAAEANAAGTRADVSASLQRAFIRLQFAQERVTLAEAIADRRRQNLDLVELRHESGSENKGSLLRTQAGTRQAEVEVEQARRSIGVQQRELSNVLGLPARTAWVARGEWTAPAPDAAPLWTELAHVTPAVRAAQARLDGARAAVSISRGAIYPDLALRAGIDRSGEEWPPDSEAWSAGVTLSVPLFTGGRNLNQLATAQAAMRQVEAQLRQAEQDAALDLESAWASLRDAREQLEVQTAFLEAAEVRAEIARAQYANGLLSFQNWDQIEDELIQSQQSVLSSRRDAALAAAEWDRVRGQSLFASP